VPIDTRNKRASAMNPACPWRGLWPEPDGTISTGDRAQIDFMYVDAGGAAAGGAVQFIVRHRRRRFDP